MGFHEFSSPYDWSRIASYKRTAKAAFGGMVDLSVGSPVDPVPDSVRKALAVSSNDPNAYGYPVTAGTAAATAFNAIGNAASSQKISAVKVKFITNNSERKLDRNTPP